MNRWLGFTSSLMFFLASGAHAQGRLPAGGGELIAPRDSLDAEARDAIVQRLHQNLALLRAEGRIPRLDVRAHPLFQWPLRPVQSFTDFGYHGISNFVDQDPGYPNHLRDFQCGTRTYDLSSGYNHSGVDIFLAPFYWSKMERGDIQIVAAAAGTILDKSDGFADHNCAIGNASVNALYVRHADGSVAWYLHMKKGSTTSKHVGQPVAAGEYLGLVGSSGSSTGPHLHFEVHNAQDNVIEPFTGDCNTLNPNTWWQQQRPYFDSAVLKLATHFAPPGFPPCPATEIENIRDRFDPGETVNVAAYYRDQLQGQQTRYRLYRPDSSVSTEWTHSSPQPHYASSYWYWTISLPQNAPVGAWTFEAVFEGQTHTHAFRVGPEIVAVPETLGLLIAGAFLGAARLVTRRRGSAARSQGARPKAPASC